jgi:hypothetical protein
MKNYLKKSSSNLFRSQGKIKLSFLNNKPKYFSTNWDNIIGLSDDQKSLKDLVNKFCIEHVAPIAAKVDKTDEFPRHL